MAVNNLQDTSQEQVSTKLNDAEFAERLAAAGYDAVTFEEHVERLVSYIGNEKGAVGYALRNGQVSTAKYLADMDKGYAALASGDEAYRAKQEAKTQLNNEDQGDDMAEHEEAHTGEEEPAVGQLDLEDTVDLTDLDANEGDDTEDHDALIQAIQERSAAHEAELADLMEEVEDGINEATQALDSGDDIENDEIADLEDRRQQLQETLDRLIERREQLRDQLNAVREKLYTETDDEDEAEQDSDDDDSEWEPLPSNAAREFTILAHALKGKKELTEAEADLLSEAMVAQAHEGTPEALRVHLPDSTTRRMHIITAARGVEYPEGTDGSLVPYVETDLGHGEDATVNLKLVYLNTTLGEIKYDRRPDALILTRTNHDGTELDEYVYSFNEDGTFGSLQTSEAGVDFYNEQQAMDPDNLRGLPDDDRFERPYTPIETGDEVMDNDTQEDIDIRYELAHLNTRLEDLLAEGVASSETNLRARVGMAVETQNGTAEHPMPFRTERKIDGADTVLLIMGAKSLSGTYTAYVAVEGPDGGRFEGNLQIPKDLGEEPRLGAIKIDGEFVPKAEIASDQKDILVDYINKMLDAEFAPKPANEQSETEDEETSIETKLAGIETTVEELGTLATANLDVITKIKDQLTNA